MTKGEWERIGAMPQHNASYAEISVIAHATEDLSKVKSAVLKVLPDEMAHKIEFRQTNMRGHHGNPIVELKIDIKNRKDAYEVLRKVLSGLSPLDSTLLDEELTKHLDERNHLYLRLDKQRAFLGEPVLASSDAISLAFRLGSRPRSFQELKAGLSTDREDGVENDANL
jgi:RNA binding exosome subunit